MPSPFVYGWVEEKRKPKDSTRCRGDTESEDSVESKGTAVEGLGEHDRCLITEDLLGDLLGDDLEADALEANLDNTDNPADAKIADVNNEDPFVSPSSVVHCLLASLRSSPPMEL